MAFAEVSDIEARWHALTDEEQSRAAVLIDDASAMLAALVTVDGTEEQAALLRTTCCSMVIRAMSATAADSHGVDSMSMTAGPYSQSWNYSNPSGDMYLTRMEKRLLGISTGYIGTIRPMMAGEHDD